MPNILKIAQLGRNLVGMVAKSAGKSGTATLQIKHDIKMFVNPSTVTKANPVKTITRKGLASNQIKGELGNVSVRLSDMFKAKEIDAKSYIGKLFPEYRNSVRTKGANSIYSKLERKVMSGKKTIEISSDSQAKSMIGDAVGARIFMPSLTKTEIREVLSTCKLNLHIPGQGLVSLSETEQKIIEKIFAGQRVSKSEQRLVQHLINPVKSKLAEKQSQPVFERLLSGSYQYALDQKKLTISQMEELVKRGELSKNIFEQVKKNHELKEMLEAFSEKELEQLARNGEISEAFLKELKASKPFEGINITELSNYRGSDGVAYFSDAQVQQLKRMQVHTGNYFNISSVSSSLSGISTAETVKKIDKLKAMESRVEQLIKNGADENEIKIAEQQFKALQKKYMAEGIDAKALDSGAIKGSGYTTTQMNFTMADGTQGELQLRGEGFFAEIEHIAYDARQNKNTLGAVYSEYVDTVKGLNDKQYKLYNKYIKDCYNYTRNLELGIQTPTPQLPKGLPNILSQRSMENLHELNAQVERAIKESFQPHIRYAA